MTTAIRCPHCGAPLHNPGNPCPRCLLGAALSAPETLSQSEIAGAISPDHPGSIGPYKILQLLGEGGMGIVYLCEQQSPIRRRVALKLLKHSYSPTVLERFEAERQALALMDHPSIAHVYDAGSTASGQPYFVMEYVDGMPITAFCDAHLLNCSERLRLFEQVCRAVHHAHQKGIIHRDLKPSNILITDQNGAPTPKIIDFGIAKAVNRRLTEKTFFTEYGVMIGTPEYMSPEQADGVGVNVDTTTDIYSLGVVLYELLTGLLPFDAKTLREAGHAGIRRMLCEQEPPRPTAKLRGSGGTGQEIARKRNSDVPSLLKALRGDLEWIVVKAMDRNRRMRYASASELAADIERHLLDEPVIASPPSTIYRLSKFVRKNKGMVAALAAILTSLTLGLIASTTLYVRAEQQRIEAERQRAEAIKQRTEADNQRRLAFHQGEEAKKQSDLREQQRLIADEQRQRAEFERTQADSERLQAQRMRQEADTQRERAEQQATESRRLESIAERQRLIADEQRASAEAKNLEVEEQKLAAEHQRLIALHQTYVANLNAADLHIRSNEIAEARRRLLACPPSLRSWEWRYLAWRTDTSIAAIQTPSAANLIARNDTIAWTSPNAIHIWRPFSADPVQTAPFSGPILTLSADASHLLTLTPDRVLHLTDAKTGKQLASFSGHAALTTTATLSPDRTRLLSSADRSLLWSARDGQLIAAIIPTATAAAFSSDDARLVTGHADGSVRVWETTTGRAMYTLTGHTRKVTSVAFTPDRSRIVSGAEDKTVRVWDALNGRAIHELTGHERPISALAIRSQGDSAASASLDGTIRLWEIQSGALITTLNADWPGDLAHVAYTPDGVRIVAASTAGQLRLWDALTYGGSILQRSGAKETIAVKTTALSPDNKLRATAQGNDVLLSDPSNFKPTVKLHGHTAPITALTFTSDSSRLISASSDRTMRVWDTAAAETVLVMRDHPDTITALSFTPQGEQLIFRTRAGSLHRWSARDFRSTK